MSGVQTTVRTKNQAPLARGAPFFMVRSLGVPNYLRLSSNQRLM